MRSTYVRRLIEDDRDVYLKHISEESSRLVFKWAFGIRVFDQRYHLPSFRPQHLRYFYESEQITTFCIPEDELLHYFTVWI